MKKISLLIFILYSLSFSAFAEPAKKLEIVTTLFPLYDFSKEIGKDYVNVSLLLPPGVEAHAFEPRPADIMKINNADIFIYTGKYMEPWVPSILKSINNKNLIIVDASKGIELMGDGGKDPHIWLDLINAQIMVDTITSAFITKDSANKDFYFMNADQYKKRLSDLDARAIKIFSDCKNKTFIYGGHFAFGYFTGRYNLKNISPYKSFSPNEEPSPKAIGALINMMKENGIKYIYHEELIDPKIARVISEETGAKMMLLNGAHNISRDQLAKGVTFVEIMEEDIEKLKEGLECEYN